MKVAVLCGGFGSRLGELTRDIPKPMLPIGGRPYLERVLASFAERGFDEFVLLTGFRSDVIETHFGDGSPFGYHVQYSREWTPLGTGGALREARQMLGSRFLLTYGDVLRRFDYDRFVNRHGSNCLAAYPRRSAGNTEIIDGRVVRFDKSETTLPYIDGGFAVICSEALDLLPAEGHASFETSVYSALAARGELAGEVVDHDFFDIGTPEELARTRAALETR